jgi:hypothetical protein
VKYTNKELGFILYNNRSVKGVINNFIDYVNPLRLILIEKKLAKSKKIFTNDNRMVEVNLSELYIEADDIIVTKEELDSLSDIFIKSVGEFSENEYNYLKNRGISDQVIENNGLFGLSQIKDKRHLDIIGASCHPILNKVLSDGIEGGGIVIPLFENNKLVNCSTRKITIEQIDGKKSLKYSLSCPDISVWGLDEIEMYDEIWLTEGLFDMMALKEMGKKCISCSSAMWSGIQLYKVIMKRPLKINIFSDNDEVGIRTSGILQNFFLENRIECDVYISNKHKDAASHYFQHSLDLKDLTKINVTDEIILENKDESFNFLNYLKNRS